MGAGVSLAYIFFGGLQGSFMVTVIRRVGNFRQPAG